MDALGANVGKSDPESAAPSPTSVLGKGNVAVYDELYPALRFYQQNKGVMSNDQIMKCMDQKPGPPLDAAITQGLRETMAGAPARGGLTMLQHEQRDTLQHSVYSSSLFNWELWFNKSTGARLTPMKYVVSADCTSSDPNRVVDFAKYPGHLYNFDDRWPFARDCANKFVQLSSDPASSASIQQELRKISNASPP